jgi:hypothetical protein
LKEIAWKATISRPTVTWGQLMKAFKGIVLQLMNAFKGIVLMLVGIAWALLWLTIFTSIADLPTDPPLVAQKLLSLPSDTRLIQASLFFIMLLGLVPFGFGINRLIR